MDLKQELRAFISSTTDHDAQRAANASLLKMPKLNRKPDSTWHDKIYNAHLDLDYFLRVERC